MIVVITFYIFLAGSHCVLDAAAAPTAEAAPPSGYKTSHHGAWRWASSAGRPPPVGLPAFIDDRFAAIQRRLELTGPVSPLFVDAFDRHAFRGVVRHYGGAEPDPWQIAIAFPARGIVVLDGAALAFNRQGSYPETLAHEIVHLVVGSAGPRVPRWYHEGLAQWLGGARQSGASFQRIAGLAMLDGLMEFEEIDRVMPETHAESSTYYDQAHLFTAFLVSRFGDHVHAAVLHAMADGDTANNAFAKVLGVSLQAAEFKWREYLRSEFSWLAWFYHNVGLFPPLSVGVVLGFFIQRGYRRRRMRRMMEQERIDDDGDDSAFAVS